MSKSSGKWLREHFSDSYVKKAQKEGYRARAVYKLLEIQEKDLIIKKSSVVVDLGAAPGSWSQVSREWIGEQGKLFALDILPMDSLAGVEFIQGDFTDNEVLNELLASLDGKLVDVVLSDMAPNSSGLKAIDQPKAMYLAELALEFAIETLKPGGIFLVKIFQGEGFELYLKSLKGAFDKVVTRKPQASRPRSREVYLLAKGYKGKA